MTTGEKPTDYRLLAEKHAETLTRVQLDLAQLPRTHAIDLITERIGRALKHHRKATT